MSIAIEDPQTDELIHRLAKLKGESPVDAVRVAVKERLERHLPEDRNARLARVRAAARKLASHPVVHAAQPDSILGYNDQGLFD